MIDYAVLKVLWWFFIFALFALFFVFGGRDFGVCILLPWVGKTNDERRSIINSIGGTWEGNQVWLVTAGGATFAAWPIVYATAFSGLYYAFILVLFALILRPPGFDYRSKIHSTTWHHLCDGALFISGFVPALVFGVGLGNLFLGLPFHFGDNLLPHYAGGFFELLNPIGLLFGLAAVSILTLQGGTFLQRKLNDDYNQRLKKANLVFGVGFILLFVLIGWLMLSHLHGYQIQSIPEKEGALIPTLKQVVIGSKNWLVNYQEYQILWILPVLVLLTTLLAIFLSLLNFPGIALWMSSLAIITALGTAGAALFPFIMPSSLAPNHSLTIWDSVSSHRTLFYMFCVAVVFLPIILSYTFWVFRVLKGKVNAKELLTAESY